jgi:predicted cobalt transporter CbtA
MIKTLLVRGMAVGIVAGLLAFGFSSLFGEPSVDRAIAFEAKLDAAKDAAENTAASGDTSRDAMAGMTMSAEVAMSHDEDAHAHDHGDEELVSRHVQKTYGLLTGTLVYGAAFGGLFALVYAFALGRIGGVSPRGLAALLALAGFICIILVPQIKYPANPPAVGDPGTIGSRTGFYLSMLVISIGAMTSAVLVGRGFVAKHGLWTASLVGGALFIAIVTVAQLILPAIDEVPAGFPADVLWRFRIASLGMHAVIWATIGLLFGYLTERSLQRDRRILRAAH